MKATDIKFRASSLGYLMTDPKSKAEKENGGLSETAKTHVIDCFISAKYKRKEEHVSKFLNKGNQREEDSITLLSRVNKTFFKKNDVRLQNDFITGEPDLYLGESIYNASQTFDTKTSWSAHTFFRAQHKELEKNYYWQGMAYMALTGAKKHSVVFCLVNGTPTAIMDEKRKMQWGLGAIDTEHNPEYLEKARQIEVNHIFDLKAFVKENPGFALDSDLDAWSFDIPMSERIYSVDIERNEEDIQRIYERVQQCHRWIEQNLMKESQSIAA